MMMRLQTFLFVARNEIHIIYTNIAWDTGISHLNLQFVSVSRLFMTFISLPCCFGEPLGDVTLWMQICGNYRYLTTRYDYPPKRAMFFRAFPFFIWLLIMLLENLQSYDENLCCLFIPKYIFAYLLLLYNSFVDARAPSAISKQRLSRCNH